MNIQPIDIWIAAGVLLGFQVASFAARINREIAVGENRDITWLPPSDVLNLLSMVVLVVGIFIFPVFGFAHGFMIYAFGLAMLLFLGFPFGLVGHYEMYNNKSKRSYQYFPLQEKVVITVIAGLAIIYVIIAMIKSKLFII